MFLLDTPDGAEYISTCLEFVGREKETMQLVENVERLYDLVHGTIEPAKQIHFSTVTGTAGKGKTTLSRLAYFQSNTYRDKIESKTYDALQECLKKGRSFRVSCEEFIDVDYADELMSERIFGIHLLFQALKYRINMYVFLYVFTPISYLNLQN